MLSVWAFHFCWYGMYLPTYSRAFFFSSKSLVRCRIHEADAYQPDKQTLSVSLSVSGHCPGANINTSTMPSRGDWHQWFR